MGSGAWPYCKVCKCSRKCDEEGFGYGSNLEDALKRRFSAISLVLIGSDGHLGCCSKERKKDGERVDIEKVDKLNPRIRYSEVLLARLPIPFSFLLIMLQRPWRKQEGDREYLGLMIFLNRMPLVLARIK